MLNAMQICRRLLSSLCQVVSCRIFLKIVSVPFSVIPTVIRVWCLNRASSNSTSYRKWQCARAEGSQGMREIQTVKRGMEVETESLEG